MKTHQHWNIIGMGRNHKKSMDFGGCTSSVVDSRCSSLQAPGGAFARDFARQGMICWSWHHGIPDAMLLDRLMCTLQCHEIVLFQMFPERGKKGGIP